MESRPFLRCLGHPALFTAGGTPIRLRSRKHLALFVYLAMDGRPHSRDQLVELLWPRVRLHEARHSLSTGLSILRAKVGRRYIMADNRRVGVARQLIDIDVDRLVAGEVLGTDMCPALDVGAFLEGLEFDDAPEFSLWKEREQGRLLPYIKKGFCALIDQARRTGEFRSIEELADRMLAFDELNEDAVRAKMEARAFAGDRLEALRVYEQWKEQIHRELSAYPSPLLEGMATRLRRRNIERTSSNNIPAVPTDQWKNRAFVGRATEYRVLYETWERGREGTPGHLFVLGESGIGKSTLVERVCTAAGLEGAVVTRIQCYDLERSVAFSAIAGLVELLLDRPGAAATAPDVLADLARIVPRVRERYPSTPRPTPTDGETARILFTEGVHRLLACVGEEQPAILVLDDIHNADEASLTVLHSLLRRLKTERIIVVLVGRSADMDRREQTTKLRRDGPRLGIHELQLGPLTDHDSDQLLQLLMPTALRPANRSTWAALLQAARGFPLVLELVAIDWQRHGEQSIALLVSATTREASEPCSNADHYRRLVEAIVQGLDPATRSVLSLAAVLGARLGELSMYSLVDLSVAQAMTGLMTLAVAHVLRESDRGLEFVNELVRAQAYWLTPSPIRTALHSLIADRLLQQPSSDDNGIELELAWHSMRAGRAQEATRYLLTGGRRALLRGAYHEAERSLTTALPHLDLESRCEAHLLLAEILQEQARWSEAAKLLQSIADPVEDEQKERYQVLMLEAGRHYTSLTGPEAEYYFDQLFLVAAQTPYPSPRARAACSLGSLLGFLRDKERGRRLRELIEEVRAGDYGPLDDARLSLALGMAMYHSGDVNGSLEVIHDAIGRLETSGCANSILVSLYVGQGAILMGQGSYGLAAPVLERAHALSLRIGSDHLTLQAAANLALCGVRIGDYETAIRYGTQSSASSLTRTLTQFAAGAQSAAIAFAMIHREREAIEVLQAKEAEVAQTKLPWLLQTWGLVSADVLALLGSRSEAMQIAREYTWGREFRVLSQSSTGAVGRWLLATAESPSEVARVIDFLRNQLRHLDRLDKLDQWEILCTLALAEAPDHPTLESTTQAVNSMPSGFREQLCRLGMMPQL